MNLADLQPLLAAMSFHPTDGGAVIYDADGKRLFALNDTAALVFAAISKGAGREAMAGELRTAFDLPAEEARDWVEQALASLARILLADRPDAGARADESIVPLRTHAAVGTDYVMFGQTLRIAAPDAATELIDTMLGHLRRRPAGRRIGAPALSITIEADGPTFVVSGVNEPDTAAGPEQLLTEIERRIVQDLIPRVPHFLAFHAALLGLHGQAVLFPASSGSGKTTLSATLAHRGWSYLTDEMALFDRTLTWQGLPFPPCIKSTSYPLIEPLYPALRHATEHDRCGRRFKFLSVPIESGPLRVAAVVFPRYRPDADARLTPLSRLDGLQQLLTHCIYVPPGFTEADVAILLEWHDQTAYYEMEFRSPQDAAYLLGGFHLGKPAVPA